VRREVNLSSSELRIARSLGLTPRAYAEYMLQQASLRAYHELGMRKLDRHIGYHGECEVCSAADQVLYTAHAKSSDGALTALYACWDCQEAIRG
jgi:DNA-directed RNA polymerase subunit M/transcription elongation factor TFIIS